MRSVDIAQERKSYLRRADLMRTVLLAAAAALGGCTQSKTADVQACERETIRFFSNAAGDEFMIACMDAKGYWFDVGPQDCDSKTRMVMQPTCYIPSGWVAAFLDEISRVHKPKSAAEER